MPKTGKILFLLLAGCMTLLSSTTLEAQSALSISYRFKNEQLEKVFKTLESKYPLTFAYDNDLIDPIIISKASAKNEKLDIALRQLLQPHGLGYEMLNNGFVLIKPVETTSISEVEKKEVLPSVCGTVLDSLNAQNLAFANVWLKGTQKGMNTNEAGFFRLFGPFNKKDTLQISYLGYHPQEIPIVDLLKQNCGNFQLSAAEFKFDQVLIEERAVALLRSENNGNGIQFESDKMGMLPGWGDNDILRMTQLIPGVHSTDESASALHIRGGTPDQNLILWEGIPIYHAGHLFGMFSAVNPAVVDQVKVYRGGFGARYGDRVSGVIDITEKVVPIDTIEFGVGLNLINAHAYLKTPVLKGKSTLVFAVRRSYTDLIQSNTYKKLFDQVSGNGKIEDHQREADEQQIDIRTNSEFYFSDVNAKWVFEPKENSNASLSFYNGRDDLEYSALVDYPEFDVFFKSNDDITLNNWGISGFWEERWSDRWESTMRMTYTKFRHLYEVSLSGNRNVDAEVEFQQQNQMSDFSFHLDNQFKFAKNQALNFGYHFTAKEVDFGLAWETATESDAQSEKFQGEISTLYLDYDYRVKDQIALDFGLRYNQIPSVEFRYWEPRITIDINLTKDVHFKTAAGKYIQFVSQMVQYNELGFGEEIWIMANRKYNLPPVASSQFSTGIWIDKKDFLFDLEFYSKRMQGLTSINLRFDNRMESPFSVGEADITGLDVLVKKQWNKYNAWLSYTLSNVDYTFPSLNDASAFPATHDQLHTINWTHILSLKKWEFSLSWNYGSGRPFTNAESISQEEQDNGNINYSVVYENRNSSRLPAYHRLDISGHYHWKGMDGTNGKIGLSIFNVYNQRNISGKRFFILGPNDQDINPELLSIDRQMLGFIPNLFLELSW